MSATRKINMLEGSLWDKLIVFALPLAFTGLLQQLYNAADVAVLGRFVSDLAVAAVGNNVPVFGLIISFCMGLSIGVNVVVARALGMKMTKKPVKRSEHLSLLRLFLAFLRYLLVKPLQIQPWIGLMCPKK